MSLRRLALLMILALGALLAAPAMADEVPDEDEAPAPPLPPPPPPPPRQAPPPERPMPPRAEPVRPMPPAPMPTTDYEPRGFYFAPELLAYEFSSADVEFGTDATSGDTFSVDNGLELGWRLGLGYRWGNRWDLIVRGTNVNSNDSRFETAAGPAGIATTFGAGFDNAMAEVDIDYTTVDAEVGYTWGAWERSHLRLFFGPRVAWINQEMKTEYDPDTGVAGDRWFTDEEQDMDALGLHVGVEGTIAFNPHWALLLTGGVGAYNGDFENDMIVTSTDGAVVVGTSSTDDDDTITQFDAALAFRWQRQAFEDGMFAIRFGWELTHWNDVPSLTDVGAASGPDFNEDDFEADGPFVRFEWIF